MNIFEQEIIDGLEESIKSQASISYASLIEPYSSKQSNKLPFKALASIEDSDLYYTQSILVSSNWNKNDDIFDKNEVWAARHSPEHKPTNLEHDEGTIIGHIVSNYPITEDGILIDENTPIENLPEKYHILTGAVIYKAYTKPDLKDRTEQLIAEIENGTKYVSMECFFKGFDYGLIDKNTGEYKVLARDNNTAYLTKHLRAYGGLGEHENYRIGRVLRNITFSGKGYVDRPANPESIIFTKDSFKFLEKKDDFVKSGVDKSQSNEHSENLTMSEQAENVVVADCAEATAAAEATVAELKTTIESMKTEYDNSLAQVTTEKDQLAAEKEEAAKKMKDDEEKMKKMEASIQELEAKLTEAQSSIAAYMKKEKNMTRKASLLEGGVDADEVDSIVEKFESLNDETFAAMTDMLKMKKKKEDKMTKADEVAPTDLTEALENVEENTEIVPAVGGEDDSVGSTRAALVDFVYNRLGKKLNKGE